MIGSGFFVYCCYHISSSLSSSSSGFFVYCCYPTSYTEPFFYPILVKCIGNRSFLEIHCCNDWLVTTWLFFFASLLWFIGSVFMLIYQYCKNQNGKEIYLYISSIFDSILFLIGSMYYIAGSYHLDVLSTNHSQRTQHSDKDIDTTTNTTTTTFEQKSDMTEKLIQQEPSVLI